MLLSQIESAIENGGEVDVYAEGVRYQGIAMAVDHEYLKILTTDREAKILLSCEWIIRIASITGFSPHLTEWNAERIYRVSPELRDCEDLTGDISDPFAPAKSDDDDDDDDSDYEIFFI